MLLDEFTSALDPEMSHKVLDLIIPFLQSNKITSLIVAHRHEEALDNADRIIVLDKGRAYCEINRDGVDFNKEGLRAVFSDLYRS